MTIAPLPTQALSGIPVIGVGVVAVVASALAFAMRRLHVPAAALVGGLLAGLMLGAAFLGRIAPDSYVRLFEGHPAVLERVVISDRLVGASAFAARSLGAAPSGPDIDRSVTDREQAHASWDSARRTHQTPFVAAALACAALVLASQFRFGARPRRPRPHDFVIALWSFALPAIAAVLVASFRGDGIVAPSTALLVGACSCGAWRVSREERAITRFGGGGIARETATAALVATVLACAVAATALYAASDFAVATPAAAALLGGVGVSAYGRARWLARIVGVCIVPTLAALIAVRVDPIRDVSLFMFAAVFLIAEDGRWLGAFAGRALGGESARIAIRTAMAGLAVGPSMLAFTAIGAAFRLLSPTSVSSLLLAAVLVEFLAPTRLRIARTLEHADAELDVDA